MTANVRHSNQPFLQATTLEWLFYVSMSSNCQNKMAANAQHENHPFLQATIVNLYIEKNNFNLKAH